jgi:hypothetical protein
MPDHPDIDVEYEVLHDDGGTRCGLMAKGDVPGCAFKALCKRKEVRYDPGDTRRGTVRWVPARESETVERWLMPVEGDGDQRGAFEATYIDNRY